MADEMDDFGMEEGMLDEGTPIQKSEPNPTPTTPAQEQFIEAGGRKFKDQAELVKAYTSLNKEYSRAQNENATYKPWMNSWKALQKHQDLYSDINQRISDYNKRLQAGQPQATAQQAAGLSPEMAQRLEVLENDRMERVVREEIAHLRDDLKADKGTIDEVVALAHERERKGLSSDLEDCYWIVMGRKQAAVARTEAEAKVKTELQQSKLANVGGSNMASVIPSPKDKAQMTAAEHKAAALAKLRAAMHKG